LDDLGDDLYSDDADADASVGYDSINPPQSYGQVGINLYGAPSNITAYS
jgi:hypothetical protein